MPDTPEIRDVDVMLRLYDVFVEKASPGESWTIDLALVNEIEKSMQTAIEFAESTPQAERASEAVAAARQLRYAIRAYGQVE